jgi:tetratricopeptide (TPR) repeat protein
MPHHLIALAAVFFGTFTFFAAPILAVGSDDGSSATAMQDHYLEAKALVEGESFVAALPILISLTREEPRNADAWNLLGYTQRKLGNFDEAATAYQTALTLNPDHLGALEYQGELFLQTGQPDLARANLDRLKSLCGACEEAEDLAKALADS